MALAEEPLRYLRKYLNVEEDLTEDLAAATADEPPPTRSRRRTKPEPKPPAKHSRTKPLPRPLPTGVPSLPHPPLQVDRRRA